MLDRAQLDQFHTQGFLVVPQLVGGEELDLLRLAANRVEADGLSGRGDHRYFGGPTGTRLYLGSDRIWERDPIFAATTAHPWVLRVVGQCLGHPFLPVADALRACQRFGKHPEPWHQAPPYHRPDHPPPTGIPHFATFILLDQVTRENGCWWALPGQHLQGHRPLVSADPEQLYHHAHPLELAAGDLLLLAAAAPRASRGNDSARTWRALEIQYLAAEVLVQAFGAAPYPERAFNPAGLALARSLGAWRHHLGLELPGSPVVTLTDAGFLPGGEPLTPPYHWRRPAAPPAGR